jgi:hypothetical protein
MKTFKPILAATLLMFTLHAPVFSKAASSLTESKGATMAKISVGENAKMTVLPTAREQLRKFYREVLGCNVIEKDGIDLIQFGNFFVGVLYDKSALKKTEYLKALWLDLRTEDPDGLKQKILKFGIKELKYWDKDHFYFQAPGGQVFRLVGKSEDMSKWQN